MSFFYQIAYSLGLAPWEKAQAHQPAADQVRRLFEREEKERQRPYGSALDLGCGSGFWAIELARRGWNVTGVDIIPTAIAQARERARKSGASVKFVQGDVTHLSDLSVGSGFDLIWDFGTLHGLSQRQCDAAGRQITSLSNAGATMLILAWKPGNRGPLPRGMSRVQIERAFPQWLVVSEEAFDATGLPPPLRKVDPRVYRLRRKSDESSFG